MPDDTPFKDTLVLAQNDPTLDPFDAIEMIGVSGSMTSGGGIGNQAAAGRQPPRRVRSTTPGRAPGR